MHHAAALHFWFITRHVDKARRHQRQIAFGLSEAGAVCWRRAGAWESWAYLQRVLLSVLLVQRLAVVGEVDHGERHGCGHGRDQHGLHHLQARAVDVPVTHINTHTAARHWGRSPHGFTEAESFALTTLAWTSPGNEAFLAVIRADGERKKMFPLPNKFHDCAVIIETGVARQVTSMQNAQHSSAVKARRMICVGYVYKVTNAKSKWTYSTKMGWTKGWMDATEYLDMPIVISNFIYMYIHLIWSAANSTQCLVWFLNSFYYIIF